ncbi:PfkB family carbohydrate kinase [Telmatobacter sp. DSM 110680]|uniref:PfkB family carbohydrate kinase n=1 Tax=Telmatobacter sp. DSM 110680 TaxID=3036704 RepID=A0AAU7DJT2_9BACT
MTAGLFVGLSTIDLIQTIDEFPSANTKAVARSQEILVGGPATNAAIAFSHLGGSATLLAPVGRHSLAHLIKEELQSLEIGLIDLAPECDLPPPISSVWVNQRGDRSVVSLNATRYKPQAPQVDRSLLRQASIVLVDGHATEACRAWAGTARTDQIPVVFDGGSWKPGTEGLLRFVDTAICSSDFRPPDCSSEDEVIEYLRAAGVSQIAITKGADPIRYFADVASGFIEVPRVDVVDTSGAGDIFHGAFCFFTATGSSFVDSLRDAARIATESCRSRGTRQWMVAR